jgi:hypothetical protein
MNLREFTTFHGTDSINLASILKDGFLKKFIGGNYGSTFGPGIYSSSDPKYASTYGNSNILIICRIRVTEDKLNVVTKYQTKRKDYKKTIQDFDLIIISDADEYLCSNPEVIVPIGIAIVEKTIQDDTLLDCKILEMRLLGDVWNLENIF